jgi:hypothetical protein
VPVADLLDGVGRQQARGVDGTSVEFCPVHLQEVLDRCGGL